jgi:hypothetical protein
MLATAALATFAAMASKPAAEQKAVKTIYSAGDADGTTLPENGYIAFSEQPNKRKKMGLQHVPLQNVQHGDKIQIFTVTLNGTVFQMTDSFADLTAAQWSPDGQMLALVRISRDVDTGGLVHDVCTCRVAAHGAHVGLWHNGCESSAVACFRLGRRTAHYSHSCALTSAAFSSSGYMSSQKASSGS